MNNNNFIHFSAVYSTGGSPHYAGAEYNVPRTSVYQPSTASPADNYYTSPKSLPIADLTANPWYHGSISRVTAENRVRNNGEFLIRDSSTQHGDYVLTVRWNTTPLHFVVNRRLAPGSGAGGVRSVYHFEENAFDSVSELIQFYIKHQKPVTEASGAKICTSVPVPKEASETKSLPVTLAKYGSQPLLNSSFDSNSDDCPQTHERRLSVPSIAKMTTVEIAIEESRVSDGQHETIASPVSTGSSPHTGAKLIMDGHGCVGSKLGSDTDLIRPPPPKPSRVPTIKVLRSQADKRPVVPIRNQALYDDDGKDYSDYDQASTVVSYVLK